MPVVGVNQPYPDQLNFNQSLAKTNWDYELTNTCNEQCHCIPDHFEPICLDGKTYFSPCYAGCDDSPDEYGNIQGCQCGPVGLNATTGHCELDDDARAQCDTKFNQALGLTFAACFFLFVSDTTIPLAVLRAVKPELKNYSMTTYWMINKVSYQKE